MVLLLLLLFLKEYVKKGEKEFSHSGTWVQKGARGEGQQQELDHSSVEIGGKKINLWSPLNHQQF